MPLEVEHRGSRPRSSARPRDSLTIGLLNNMPDAALEATELQFATLLGAAAGARTVRLCFSSLPHLPRGPEARARIDSSYWELDELLAEHPDALIVTGTEPRTPALEEEPYWERLARLVAWAEVNTAATIWSCLAAHAVAQALHGVRRRRLPEKRFGVFEHRAQAGHPLLQGVQTPLLTPHSRWNDLPAEALEAAGCNILSFSAETGADLFVSARRSLLVCFQGHPEYEPASLLKEYRRDVGRYLRGEQPAWPGLPHGYFSPEALQRIEAFRRGAEAARDPELLADFPFASLAAGLEARWQPGAAAIYRNWLIYVATANERKRRPAVARVSSRARAKRMNSIEAGLGPVSPRTTRERLLALVRKAMGAAGAGRPLAVDARLPELGISSIKMVGLMLAIEAEFNITIVQSEITPENFASIASIEAMLERISS